MEDGSSGMVDQNIKVYGIFKKRDECFPYDVILYDTIENICIQFLT